MVAMYVHSFVSLVFYIFTVVLLSLELLPLKILVLKKKFKKKKKMGPELFIFIYNWCSFLDNCFCLLLAFCLVWEFCSFHFTITYVDV